MHQDIAPQNLLVDPDTQNLLLFDFDWAANGEKNLLQGRDDISGVVFTLYEIITGDTSFTSIPHWDRNMETVQNMSEWTCNRELDSNVSTFRNFLNEWVTTRRSPGDMQRYLDDNTSFTGKGHPRVGSRTLETVCDSRLAKAKAPPAQITFRWGRWTAILV